jgi:hypothetical protein
MTGSGGVQYPAAFIATETLAITGSSSFADDDTEWNACTSANEKIS